VSLMLACAQLGVTVCSVGLGVVAEPAIAHLLQEPMLAVGLPMTAVHAISLVLALAIVVYLHVVIGEMVPKNLAVAGPMRAALWFAPALVWLSPALADHPCPELDRQCGAAGGGDPTQGRSHLSVHRRGGLGDRGTLPCRGFAAGRTRPAHRGDRVLRIHRRHGDPLRR